MLPISACCKLGTSAQSQDKTSIEPQCFYCFLTDIATLYIFSTTTISTLVMLRMPETNIRMYHKFVLCLYSFS